MIPRAEIICQRCGESAMINKYIVKKQRYCSAKCAGEASWDGKRRDPIERFNSKLSKAGPDDCWVYKNNKTGFAYGSFYCDGKTWLAHIFAYELANGPIQKTADNPHPVVRHVCDNPPCCNPKHLTLGTAGDNIKDSWDRNRRPKRVYPPGKLTPDVVSAIATSDLPTKSLANSLNLSYSYVVKVRRKLKQSSTPHSEGSE